MGNNRPVYWINKWIKTNNAYLKIKISDMNTKNIIRIAGIIAVVAVVFISCKNVKTPTDEINILGIILIWEKLIPNIWEEDLHLVFLH